MRDFFIKTVGVVAILSLFIFVGAYVFPWGRVKLADQSTIAVTGTAQKDEKNQIANFSATVEAVKEKKEDAVAQVNSKMSKLLEEIKAFGVDARDIKTEQVSVYEEGVAEILIYPPPPRRPDSDKAQWRASNSISIKLRDVDKASGLADVLNGSGATNVYGPNLTLDDTQAGKDELVISAMENAREKAERIAKAGGRRLGRVVGVAEIGLYAMGQDAVSSPIEPGTTGLSKSLTVIFELR